MADKTRLEFDAISRRLREIEFPKVDVVVAILRGGLVPGFLVAHQLGGLPVKILGISHRDDENEPLRDTPVETLPLDLGDFAPGARVLLVDDVIVSGKTIQVAMEYLKDYAVTTFSLKGKGDIVAFPEIPGCVHWPWNER